MGNEEVEVNLDFRWWKFGLLVEFRIDRWMDEWTDGFTAGRVGRTGWTDVWLHCWRGFVWFDCSLQVFFLLRVWRWIT